MPSLRSMENAQIGAAKREKKYPLPFDGVRTRLSPWDKVPGKQVPENERSQRKILSCT